MRNILNLIAMITVLALPATTFGALVIFDDFEGVTPNASVDTSTVLGGTWQDFSACPCQGVTVGDGPAFVQNDSTSGLSAGAGNNYLRLSDVTGRRDAILDFDESVRSQLVDGVPVRLEYDLYYLGGFAHFFLLDDQGLGAGKGKFQYEFAMDPNNAAGTGAANNTLLYRSVPINRADSTLTVTPNTWTHISFEQTLGTGTATLTVGGNSVALTDTTALNVDHTSYNEGNGNIGQFFLTISSGADQLIDNISLTVIPEPGTFGLVIGGLLLLGARRLRRR